MNNVLKYFSCSFLILYSSSSVQSSSKDSSKELSRENPPGLIISGDSAYFPEALAQPKFQNVPIDSLKGQPQFIPVDKFPQVTTFARPSLSEEARTSGIIGNTKVKIWIDNEGIPQLAIIVQSSNAIFNRPSLLAAMNCRFTPAIMNKCPVGAWVTIPFRFPK